MFISCLLSKDYIKIEVSSAVLIQVNTGDKSVVTHGRRRGMIMGENRVNWVSRSKWKHKQKNEIWWF